MSLSFRIGQFFLFVGLITLIIFFAALSGNEPVGVYFCAGALLFLIGIFLMFRFRSPGKTSGRFRVLRKEKEERERKA
jgi:cytochrome c biogenesis protein CcdA